MLFTGVVIREKLDDMPFKQSRVASSDKLPPSRVPNENKRGKASLIKCKTDIQKTFE
jgi:hypothetical protein